MISKEAIDEFKQIYFQDTGELLSDEMATEEALSLYNGLLILFDHSIDKKGLKEP